jgi:hypothetical protein
MMSVYEVSPPDPLAARTESFLLPLNRTWKVISSQVLEGRPDLVKQQHSKSLNLHTWPDSLMQGLTYNLAWANFVVATVVILSRSDGIIQNFTLATIDEEHLMVFLSLTVQLFWDEKQSIKFIWGLSSILLTCSAIIPAIFWGLTISRWKMVSIEEG